MKRAFLGLAAAAFVAVPSVSHAQRAHAASSPIKFDLSANVSMPMSDWSDAVGTGLGIRGSASKALTGSPMFVRGDLGYTYYTSKDQGGGASTKGNQVGASVDLGYNIAASSSMKPYLLGGVNYDKSSLTADFGSGNGTASDNSGFRFGFNAGVGMRFKMGAHVARLEGRYMNQGSWQGAKLASFPISFGVEF
jgi:hypothetical protein